MCISLGCKMANPIPLVLLVTALIVNVNGDHTCKVKCLDVIVKEPNHDDSCALLCSHYEGRHPEELSELPCGLSAIICVDDRHIKVCRNTEAEECEIVQSDCDNSIVWFGVQTNTVACTNKRHPSLELLSEYRSLHPDDEEHHSHEEDHSSEEDH